MRQDEPGTALSWSNPTALCIIFAIGSFDPCRNSRVTCLSEIVPAIRKGVLLVVGPRTLLLPVRVAVREIDARLLLGLAAAERGFRVLIGAEADILTHPQPGLFLSHTLRNGRASMEAHRLGHVVAAFDEEALVRFPDPVQNRRLDRDIFAVPRLLLAWGLANADYWKGLDGYRGTPIEITGNCRGDLLRPDVRGVYTEEVGGLRERFGRFVLINTNFSFVNHFDPAFYRTADLPAGLVAHKAVLMQEFLKLVPALATAIAPAHLVLRPHPSEDWRAWRQAAHGQTNVTVLNEGSIVPWLMAADCVVHNGCTSAVEAAMLGRQAFAFRPVSAPDYDLELPNALSRQFATRPALVEAVRETLTGAETGQVDERLLGHHVAARDGLLASDRMADALSKVLSDPGQTRSPSKRFWAFGRKAIYGIGTSFPLTRRLRYVAHLARGLGGSELVDKVEGFRRVTGRFRDVRAQIVGRTVLLEGRG